MDTLFVIAVVVITFCMIFRNKIKAFLNKEKVNDIEEIPAANVVGYKILAFNAKDYDTTQKLEEIMELKLTQCLDAMTRRGENPEINFYGNGFVNIFLIKYTY